MPLERTKVRDEFVEAMRARLDDAAKPNVDNEEVKKNFDALGWGVIRTLTLQAETFSDATTDAASGGNFWAWVVAVNTWLNALSAWQAGVTSAFRNWTPTTAPEQNMRNAVLAVPAPGSPPAAAPAALKGKIR